MVQFLPWFICFYAGNEIRDCHLFRGKPHASKLLRMPVRESLCLPCALPFGFYGPLSLLTLPCHLQNETPIVGAFPRHSHPTVGHNTVGNRGTAYLSLLDFKQFVEGLSSSVTGGVHLHLGCHRHREPSLLTLSCRMAVHLIKQRVRERHLRFSSPD